MEVKVRECENCQGRTDNRYVPKGWISFSPPVNITIAKGIYDGSCNRTYYKSEVEDLCSIECFHDFMKNEDIKK